MLLETQDIYIDEKAKRQLIKKIKELNLDTMGLVNYDGEIDFGAWDGHKIEGYWYNETVDILIAIAPYIEGFAEFRYEEGYYFRILFEKGKAFFQRGEINYNEKEELLKWQKKKE